MNFYLFTLHNNPQENLRGELKFHTDMVVSAESEEQALKYYMEEILDISNPEIVFKLRTYI